MKYLINLHDQLNKEFIVFKLYILLLNDYCWLNALFWAKVNWFKDWRLKIFLKKCHKCLDPLFISNFGPKKNLNFKVLSSYHVEKSVFILIRNFLISIWLEIAFYSLWWCVDFYLSCQSQDVFLSKLGIKSSFN